MGYYEQLEHQEEMKGFWESGKKCKEAGLKADPPPLKTASSYLEAGMDEQLRENHEAYMRGYNGEPL